MDLMGEGGEDYLKILRAKVLDCAAVPYVRNLPNFLTKVLPFTLPILPSKIRHLNSSFTPQIANQYGNLKLSSKTLNIFNYNLEKVHT